MTHFLKYIFFIILFAAGTDGAACRGVKKSAKPAPETEFTVVIDPGHGGKDSGCVGKSAKEKDINLRVATLLREMINDDKDKIKVILTRKDDRYLTLQQRADVANRNKGDLFISIHVNSIDYKTPGRETVSGASVYTVGVDKEQSTLNVAMRENAVIELEADFTTRYSGFDPSSAESYIIFELSNNLHQRQSVNLATAIQQELVTTAGRDDKGVRQAGFWVLWATSMPSVLVELDFICNPECEKFLASDDGCRKCAQALYNAFKTYHGSYMAKRQRTAEQALR